jgi:hypothetical protein
VKTYKNISQLDQLDIEPGQTGEREISQEQEDRMVARGDIEVVGESKTEAETPEVPVEETEEKTPEQIEAEQAAAAEAAKKAEDEAQAAATQAEQRGSGRRGR